VRSALLVTSNGIGMGHLARQAAVGLAAGEDARVTLLSMSAALPTVTSLGIEGEYCPGPDRDWVPEPLWAQYLAARLQALAKEVEADVVVFDGVAPYRGVTLARTRMPDTPFVWFRRGMWRRGVNEGQLWKSGLFDFVIEPGEIASAGDVGATSRRTDAVRVPPVSLVEVVERLERTEAAGRLGLDPNRPTVLMTLGTGRLGDVSTPGRIILDALLDEPEWQVGVVTSSIANATIPVSRERDVVEIKGVFPLVRYLNAFDAAISAAGYNAVHELIPAGLPTLLVPNTATRTDDQEARAREVARRRLALNADSASQSDLTAAVGRLLTEDTRAELRDAILGLAPEELGGGALATWRELSRAREEFTATAVSIGKRMLQMRDRGKQVLKEMLGPKGTNTVRRLLGRPSSPVGRRLRVVVSGAGSVEAGENTRTLTFTEKPDVETLLDADPVEHLLPGSDSAYAARRKLIAHDFYDVVDDG
jgi:UDP:flavonoid glycosyltransferase YjiC (YdhE family)